MSDARTGRSLTQTEFLIGTAIAIAMGTVFFNLSSGLSLIVTFVPGIAFAWAIFLWMYLDKVALPDAQTFVAPFFVALAIQFLHFAEEFVTDFKTFFPELYGGAPFANDLFVTFNMVSYAVFTLSCLAVAYRRIGFLLVPVLFYVIYGAIGNAISHTWWVVDAQAYRPGFVTAQLYWIAGPWLLAILLKNRAQALIAVVAFGAILVPLLASFAVR